MKRPVGSYCTTHCITTVTIEAVIREKIGWLQSAAEEKGARFVDDLYENQGEIGVFASKEVLADQISRLTIRQQELGFLLKKLYEDHLSGKVPDQRYDTLSESVEIEIHSVKEQARKYETIMDENIVDQKNEGAEYFLEFLTRYQPDDELDYDILKRLLSKIKIHERKERYSRNCTHNIEVIFK